MCHKKDITNKAVKKLSNQEKDRKEKIEYKIQKKI